jgi:hypothetical protein
LCQVNRGVAKPYRQVYHSCGYDELSRDPDAAYFTEWAEFVKFFQEEVKKGNA